MSSPMPFGSDEGSLLEELAELQAEYQNESGLREKYLDERDVAEAEVERLRVENAELRERLDAATSDFTRKFDVELLSLRAGLDWFESREPEVRLALKTLAHATNFRDVEHWEAANPKP